MSKRQGPLLEFSAKCWGCQYVENTSYQRQNDTGVSVYCTHPSFEAHRSVGDTDWTTPGWCPFLDYFTLLKSE